MPNPRDQRLQRMEHLQEYNNAGANQDMSQQAASMKSMLQFYGMQHEQELQPGALQAQALENQGRQQELDPRMHEAKIGGMEANATYAKTHAGYEAAATDELGDARHSREFQQRATAMDKMYPPNHPMREKMMAQLAEQYYPGITGPSASDTPAAHGNFADGGTPPSRRVAPLQPLPEGQRTAQTDPNDFQWLPEAGATVLSAPKRVADNIINAGSNVYDWLARGVGSGSRAPHINPDVESEDIRRQFGLPSRYIGPAITRYQ